MDVEQPTELVASVRRWLREQGYALEYEAARVFRDAGFAARQGQVYRDGDITREVDVVAVAQFDGPSQCDFIVVVECKKSKAPWVVRRAELDDDQRSWEPIASKQLKEWLVEHRTLDAYLSVGTPTGIDVVQTHFKSGEERERSDAAYRAVAQVVSAARGLLRSSKRATLIYPVVVLDAPLLTLNYDDLGEDHLQEWGWDRLLWSGGDLPHPTAVDIVKREDLPGRAARLHAELDRVRVALPAQRSFTSIGGPQGF
jgi:hypothetical protein